MSGGRGFKSRSGIYFCFVVRAPVYNFHVIVQLVKNLRSTIIFSSSAALFHFNKEHAVHKGPPLTVVFCDEKSIWLVFRIRKLTHEAAVTCFVYGKTAMFGI